MTGIVADDGTLSLPLYHGTSSYFWPSIREHGLGGVNIVEEWQLVALLQEALAELQAVPDAKIQNELRLRLPFLRNMAEQRISGGGFNWRHGSVYLTLSPWKAVSYASRGFGSELLGQVAETLDLLASFNPDAEVALASRYPRMSAARSAPHRPVLIRLDGVSLSRLLDENGGDAGGAISLAETFVGLGDSEPQVSFELIGSIQHKDLTAAEVQVTEERYGMPRAWANLPLQ